MNALIAPLIFIAGLLLGALLNIVIIRLPRERAMGGWPRCTRCGRPLAWWQALPLVGWVAQGGRGRCCGRPLRWIFPLVELISGVTLVWLYAWHGAGMLFFYLAFVAAVLIVTGAIDWLHRSIYTFVILGATALALIASVYLPGHSLPNAFLGLLVAGFVFFFFFMLARMLFPAHAVPFGLGDVYLGMFLGAAFGFLNLVPVIFSGMLLAGIYSTVLIVARAAGRKVPQYIAYGTFLCIGALGFLLTQGL